MASIEPLINRAGVQTWRVRYRLNGRATSDTVATAHEAARHQAAVERLGGAAARELLYIREGSETHDIVTLGEFATAHVDGMRGLTAGTRKDYVGMISRRIVGTVLGDLPIEMVTRQHVEAWLDDLEAAGLATKTRRNYHALLSTVLTAAVVADLRASNPAVGQRFKRREVSHRITFLSAGEFAILLGSVDDYFVPFVAWLAGTGMRFGEATSITVGDVDLDAPVPVAHVVQAWKRTGTHERELGAPKTPAGTRTIPLAPELVRLVRHLVDERPTDALLFTAKQGGPIRNDHFHSRVWTPLKKQLADDGIMRKKPTVHALRHTYASAQIAAGVNLLDLKVYLGHESIKTTVDTYGHLVPGALAGGAAAASLFLRQALPEVLELEA